ncbi:hypothetical protein GLYMA_08G224900v4 [Glycine max]|uniref:Uncharacterized protein n=1 Tax=Glycine max TaxID=3847 RepID=K7L864_SOYBN|nr:hypothetical protein GYH30_022069 [Glycine max]KHN38101.1 hypothetical protein glysoja_007143 [Glycine soja]KRH44679.1 hypothetical protein GLYMA_08G224900v4 [Glycine max]
MHFNFIFPTQLIRVCSDLLRVPLDPLEWQISQESANAIVAWLANTIGATTRGCFSRSFSYRCLCRTCLPSALNL